MKASQIVNKLLQGSDAARELIREATVYRPRRGSIWVASFSGVDGQEWKSTGTVNQAIAMARAKEFEAAARLQKLNSERAGKRRTPGIRHSTARRDHGLTQRETALILKLSERAVRQIERRALRKLARHPGLRELWREFLTGELMEQAHRLSAPEIKALVGLTRTPAERVALRKALELAQAG